MGVFFSYMYTYIHICHTKDIAHYKNLSSSSLLDGFKIVIYRVVWASFSLTNILKANALIVLTVS